MEEILASIRKIIAEDTSGSRMPPPAPPRAQPSPVRPNAGVKPAASPQRGFMSREAFMKSPASAEEPGEKRFFTPVTPQDPLPATEAGPKPGASEPGSAKASPLPAARDEVTAEAEPAPAKSETSSALKKADVQSNASEQAQPGGKSIAADVKAIVEAEQKSAPPESKSEAQIIDAQLVELLGEDLKALREAGERQEWTNAPTLAAAAKVAPSAEPLTQKPQEQAASVNGAAPAVAAQTAPRPETPDVSDANADPFAFDLGPSPFLPRSLAGKAPEQKISTAPEVDRRTAAETAPASAPAPQRALTARQSDEQPKPAAPIQGMPNGASVFSQAARPAPVAPRNPEPAAPRPAPFAVPSVSATLGPHRRLEPLSESFRPAAPEQSKPAPPSPDPFPFRDFRSKPEPSPEPARPQIESRLQPAPAASSLSALPPLDAEADPVIGGDRTMEDAVADLLRPLLKTWLAENMPKIVERALRREMTERLLPGQKNVRD
jgi:cell pole-organizing protein PopZ